MHFTSIALPGLLPLLAESSQTINRIKTPSGGALAFGRMDPVISPGKDSAHVHTITGGNGFSIDMGNEDALHATCTNSQIKKDGSNYWVPSLYFHKDGKFTSVKMNYMNVYYKFDGPEKIVAWEPGFRMVAGNPFLRSPPAGGYADNINTGPGKTIQPVVMTCPTNTTSPARWPTVSTGMNGVGVGKSEGPTMTATLGMA